MQTERPVAVQIHQRKHVVPVRAAPDKGDAVAAARGDQIDVGVAAAFNNGHIALNAGSAIYDGICCSALLVNAAASFCRVSGNRSAGHVECTLVVVNAAAFRIRFVVSDRAGGHFKFG